MAAVDRALTVCRLLLSGRAATYADLEAALGVSRRTALRWVSLARERFGADFRERRLEAHGEKVFWVEDRAEWMRRLRKQPPTRGEMAALAAVAAEGHRTTPGERAALAALRHRLAGALEGPRREEP